MNSYPSLIPSLLGNVTQFANIERGSSGCFLRLQATDGDGLSFIMSICTIVSKSFLFMLQMLCHVLPLVTKLQNCSRSYNKTRFNSIFIINYFVLNNDYYTNYSSILKVYVISGAVVKPSKEGIKQLRFDAKTKFEECIDALPEPALSTFDDLPVSIFF